MGSLSNILDHFKYFLWFKILSESHSVVSDSLQPHGRYGPWNSPDQNTGVGSLSLLQRIFTTQGSNPDLPHCRRILYQLSHQGSLLNINPFISSNIVSRVVSKCVSDHSNIWSDCKSISSGSLFFCVVLNFYQKLLTFLRKMVLGIWGDWGGRNLYRGFIYFCLCFVVRHFQLPVTLKYIHKLRGTVQFRC